MFVSRLPSMTYVFIYVLVLISMHGCVFIAAVVFLSSHLIGLDLKMTYPISNLLINGIKFLDSYVGLQWSCPMLHTKQRLAESI